jgi:hypothetical protein
VSARRRVDLRTLPHGLGYVIALAVAAGVVALAWWASRGKPQPAWWTGHALPILYWSSPFIFAYLVWRYVRLWRRRGGGR